MERAHEDKDNFSKLLVIIKIRFCGLFFVCLFRPFERVLVAEATENAKNDGKKSYFMIFPVKKYHHREEKRSVMYPFERKEKILGKLQKVGQIMIGEDAKLFGVSASTLHRDLEELENEGLVKKVRGGAILVEASKFETLFDIRLKTRVKEKEEIAKKAVDLVKDDTSIFLDHSSTTLFIARELRRRPFRNLVVLTNSLVTPTELAVNSGIQVRLTGGIVMHEFKALAGRWVIDSFERLNIHQVFVSVGAISPEIGLMTQVPFIHDILPEVLKFGGEKNVLADSSKFFKLGTFQISPLSASLTIFTDRGLPKDMILKIEQKGTRVIL